MSNPNSTERIRELIHEFVDSTATTVQNIHRTIASASFDALAEADALERSARELHEKQEWVLSAVYDTVRKINRKTQQLGDELFG